MLHLARNRLPVSMWIKNGLARTLSHITRDQQITVLVFQEMNHSAFNQSLLFTFYNLAFGCLSTQ